MTNHKYNLVSLFSGAGGFDYGFELTGRWTTQISTDVHPVMCETLRRNRGLALPDGRQYLERTQILQGDVQRMDIPKHSEGLDIDLVLGGPPCQSFSVMGKHGGYKDERGSLIYGTRKGTPLSRRNLLNRQLKPTAAVVGLTGINWHWLRHANATLHDSVGTPLGTLQALLGHSSSEVTREVYLHSVPADAQQAVAKVEKALLAANGHKWTQVLRDAKPASRLIQ